MRHFGMQSQEQHLHIQQPREHSIRRREPRRDDIHSPLTLLQGWKSHGFDRRPKRHRATSPRKACSARHFPKFRMSMKEARPGRDTPRGDNSTQASERQRRLGAGCLTERRHLTQVYPLPLPVLHAEQSQACAACSRQSPILCSLRALPRVLDHRDALSGAAAVPTGSEVA